MGKNFFIVREKLPSLNTVLSNHHNWAHGNRTKRELENRIVAHIIASHTEPVTKPCVILIDFYEKTMRRDVDNIQSATKFLLDAAQTAGILPNDNRKWVQQIYHRIFEAEDDYVIVYFFTEGEVQLFVNANTRRKT